MEKLIKNICKPSFFSEAFLKHMADVQGMHPGDRIACLDVRYDSPGE